YSLVYRFPELNGMKATCDELGVKILAYSPLGLGALTGKWTETSLPDGPRGQIATKLLKDPSWPLLLDAMKDVAKQHGAGTTLSQVAIAWCIAKGTTPIP
ncbi:PLR1, partial [Symbiodinium sp. KB8]